MRWVWRMAIRDAHGDTYRDAHRVSDTRIAIRIAMRFWARFEGGAAAGGDGVFLNTRSGSAGVPLGTDLTGTDF